MDVSKQPDWKLIKMEQDLSSTAWQAVRSIKVDVNAPRISHGYSTIRAQWVLAAITKSRPTLVTLKVILPKPSDAPGTSVFQATDPAKIALILETVAQMWEQTAAILAVTASVGAKLSLGIAMYRRMPDSQFRACITFLECLAGALRGLVVTHLSLPYWYPQDKITDPVALARADAEIVKAATLAGPVTSFKLSSADFGALREIEGIRRLKVVNWTPEDDGLAEWEGLWSLLSKQAATLAFLSLECSRWFQPAHLPPIVFPALRSLAVTIYAGPASDPNILFHAIQGPNVSELEKLVEADDVPLWSLLDGYPRLQQLQLQPAAHCSYNVARWLAELSDQCSFRGVNLSLTISWDIEDEPFPIYPLSAIASDVRFMHLSIEQLGLEECDVEEFFQYGSLDFRQLEYLELGCPVHGLYIPGQSSEASAANRFWRRYTTILRNCSFPVLHTLGLEHCLLPDAYAFELATILAEHEWPSLTRLRGCQMSPKATGETESEWGRDAVAEAMEVGSQ